MLYIQTFNFLTIILFNLISFKQVKVEKRKKCGGVFVCIHVYVCLHIVLHLHI